MVIADAKTENVTTPVLHQDAGTSTDTDPKMNSTNHNQEAVAPVEKASPTTEIDVEAIPSEPSFPNDTVTTMPKTPTASSTMKVGNPIVATTPTVDIVDEIVDDTTINSNMNNQSSSGSNTNNGNQKIVKKKAPLIIERHTWLQEQESIRKRQSISEDELQKLKEQNASGPSWPSSPSKQQQQQEEEQHSSRPPTEQDDVPPGGSLKVAGVDKELPPPPPPPTTTTTTTTDSEKNTASHSTMMNRQQASPSLSPPPRNRNRNDNRLDHRDVVPPTDIILEGCESMRSIDSLDRVDRNTLGEARKHQAGFHATESSENDTVSEGDHGSANNNNSNNQTRQPLATLQVADSTFLGSAHTGPSLDSSDIAEFVASIQRDHPTATHIPYAWSLLPPTPSSSTTINSNTKNIGNDHDHDKENKRTNNDNKNNESSSTFNAANGIATTIHGKMTGYDEDGEPPSSTGPFLLEQVQASWHEKDGVWLYPE